MSSDSLPLVSIITPVYNGAEYLDDLIQSVLQQDYPNVEHVIIDDGSKDEGATIAILKKYSHLRWWSRENKGQYATMNEGLLAANGDVVCFVSADDVLCPGAVATASKFLSANENYAGVFGKTGFMNADGTSLSYPVPFQLSPMSLYPYFAHISHCSLYLRKMSVQEHNLLFDPTLFYVGDYDWMIRISKEDLLIGAIDQELAKVRVHESQASQKHLAKSVIEKKKVLEDQKVNFLSYSLLWGFYLFCFRTQKVIMTLREVGVRETVKRTLNYFQ